MVDVRITNIFTLAVYIIGWITTIIFIFGFILGFARTFLNIT